MTSSEPGHDSEDFLRALLNISPEDAGKVREKTPEVGPMSVDPPHEIRFDEIAVGDIIVVPDLFGEKYPVLVTAVVEPNAVGGPVLVVKYSHGPKAKQEESVQIPWVSKVTRLGSAL